MKDHICDTPGTGLPGERWRCPTCGRTWIAVDPDYDIDGAFIEWIEAPSGEVQRAVP